MTVRGHILFNDFSRENLRKLMTQLFTCVPESDRGMVSTRVELWYGGSVTARHLKRPVRGVIGGSLGLRFSLSWGQH